MDTEVDLTTVDRDVLIAIIAQLQATVLEQQRVIERLERRIAELEGQAKPGGPPRMPGLLGPEAPSAAAAQKAAATASPAGHPVVVETIAGRTLWIQRTREIAGGSASHRALIAGPAQCVGGPSAPRATGRGLGRQRLGVNVLSLIATLREEGRLPIRSIQWYLRPCISCASAWGPS